MSIRVTLLTLMVTGLAIYAWRDWFKALCGLILLMAVMEHPDMPKSIMGIQGLNPWNLLMASVLAAWLIQRRHEGLVWDMPLYINVMLLLYLAVIVTGFCRMIVDRERLSELTTGYLVSEYLINMVKWVLPGLLLFDGCRTRRRLGWALASILSLYFLLALQVIRWMPMSSALSGEGLTARSRKLLLNEVGYHAVNLSMLLAGACWAIIAALPLIKARWQRVALVGGALTVAYAQALTAGRMGYVTWGVVGLIMTALRWRRFLWLVPAVPLVAAMALPGVTERMMSGFGVVMASGDEQTDDYEVTAGRTIAWPYVIDQIMESPLLGYGQQAMVRTGVSERLWTELRESFPHPHQAYLQLLLDNGVVGFLIIVPFYLTIVGRSALLFLDRQNPWCSAVGGACLALVLALLVASMGSQTFYPREGAVGMWAAMGLMLRLSVDRQRQVSAVPSLPFRYAHMVPWSVRYG